ncbi:unnamed protein product [Nippostrongylus brasiliensis]|uniref:M7 n=1 Tax=Nippostrongylus brasiliensis TaxID=27835 RepID=A0A0N4YAJ6_NIPBR|nr:unnamed protein product [Nippostrongylus brasiliensis]
MQAPPHLFELLHLHLPDDDSAADPSHSGNGPSTVAGSMFGNTCIRACGIEDIQYAARSAGDMFIALRFCIVFSTIGFLLCMIVLTATITYMICSKLKQMATLSKILTN